MADKSKYWVCTMYNENMIDNWQDKVEDLLQVPVAYCVHDMDKNENDTEKKVHTHFLMAYTNTTTQKNVKGLFEKLQKQGFNAFTPQGVAPCKNVKKSFDYLIHDTKDAEKKGKYKYPVDKRILLNDFCIDDYFQISSGNSRQIKIKLCQMILNDGYDNIGDLFQYVYNNCDDCYIDILMDYSGLFERMCKSNHYKYKKGI